MLQGFEAIQGKHTMKILFIISTTKFPFYNQIKKALSNLNLGSLSSRLKKLEESGLIKREIHKGVLIRVSYTLTEVGDNFFFLLFPALIYFAFASSK